MASWLSSFSSWFRFPQASTTRHIFYGIVLGLSLSVTSTSLVLYTQKRRRERLERIYDKRPIELRSDEVVDGVTGLIGAWLVSFHSVQSVLTSSPLTGNTPLIRINSLSNALGVEILGKAEVGRFTAHVTTFPIMNMLHILFSVS